MSNRLKQITTKAKALYKTEKFAKWTDAIKAASKQTGTTKKKIGAVKKKAAPKKKAQKVSTHKDTKSHNVKINVTSGIGAVKTAGIGILKDKYGKLHIKKLSEKTKRGKKAIQKELSEVAKKIKKLQTI